MATNKSITSWPLVGFVSAGSCVLVGLLCQVGRESRIGVARDDVVPKLKSFLLSVAAVCPW